MSLARLALLHRLVQAHDPDLADWFSASIRRWQAGLTLETALELRGPGARRLRDAAIRRLAELLDPTGTCSRWALAGRVVQTLKRRPTTGEIGAVAAAVGVIPSRRTAFEILPRKLQKESSLIHLGREHHKESRAHGTDNARYSVCDRRR